MKQISSTSGKTETAKKAKTKKQDIKSREKMDQAEEGKCNDRFCPVHNNMRVRGRSFYGTVTRKFHKRLAIEFERTVYLKKYERYMKRKTRIHARLPECMSNNINVGDYIEVKETRPISKIINFVTIKKISRTSTEEKQGK